MNKKDRKSLVGWSIDNDRAMILDDGFRVTKAKDGTYRLRYFIADTSDYYHKKGKKPSPLNTQKFGSKPDMPKEEKLYHYSLTETDTTHPAIAVSLTIDKNGRFDPHAISVEHVDFKNIKQLTETEATSLFRQGNEEMVELYNLATLIDTECGTHRLEKIQYSNPGNFIQTQFSNIANAALTRLCQDKHIPIIYQNRSAYIPTLNDEISTREEAYEALDILYEESEKIEASCHAQLQKMTYSTTSTGNIEKGFEHFARFSSPMQCVMDCSNIFNLSHYLSTPETSHYPIPNNQLENIANTLGEVKEKGRLKQQFNKASLLEQEAQHTLDSCDANFVKQKANIPHIAFVLKTIFEHYEETERPRPALTKACHERIQKFKHNPAYLLKIALINNPQKTEPQKELAQCAFDKILENDITEHFLRLSVEQAGDYDALYIEKENLGTQTVYRPILVKEGELLSIPRIAPTLSGQDDHQKLTAMAFKHLLGAIKTQTLVPRHQTSIEWSKKNKKLLTSTSQNTEHLKTIP